MERVASGGLGVLGLDWCLPETDDLPIDLLLVHGQPLPMDLATPYHDRPVAALLRVPVPQGQHGEA